LKRFFAFTVLISVLISSYAPAADCESIPDSLALKAEGLASSGDLKGVERLVKGLSGPEAGALYVKLGHIFLENGHIKGAEKLFRKAVISKGEVAEAWYGLGLVYSKKRLGKFRAIEAFKKAVEKDPRMAKAELETARVYRSLGPLGVYSAKDHYLKALEIDPDNYQASMELADLLEVNFRDIDGAMEHYRRAWNIRPTSSEAAYLLADGYLEKREYKKALSILERGIAHSSDDRWRYIAAMGVAYIGLGDAERAWELFEEAISAMPDSEAVLYKDLSIILSGDRLKTYRKLSGEAKREFEREFWVANDPTPLTALNERRLEHYRRVWHARNRFSCNAYPWDNRGEVYVRYGEPDYKCDSNSPNFTMSPGVEEIKRKVSGRFNPAGTNYAWGPSYPVEDNVRWERWVYLGTGVDLTFTDQVSNGRYIYAPPPPSSSVLSTRLMTELMESSPGEQAKRAFASIPATYSHDYNVEPLHIPHYLATFKGDGGRTRLEIYYGAIESELKPIYIRGRRVLSLETGIAVFDSKWNRVYSRIDTIRWFQSSSTGNIFIGQKELELEPGRYHLTTRFRDDIELASGIRPAGDNDKRFIKNELKIVPMPTRIYRPGDIAHIYFEIYNLRRGERFGETEYRVTYSITTSEHVKKGIFNRLKRLFRRRREVGISSEERDITRDIPMHLAIDLSNQEPGRLTLRVKVADLNGDTSDSKEIELLVK